MGADLSLETHSNSDSLSSGIHYYMCNTIEKKKQRKAITHDNFLFPERVRTIFTCRRRTSRIARILGIGRRGFCPLHAELLPAFKK